MNGEDVVIGDFGLSKKGKIMTTTYAGSPAYMAPEILKGQIYSNQADMWSVGVTFYEMLFGDLPFNGDNEQELYNSIHSYSGSELRFPYNNKVSIKCKQLLIEILQEYPEKRLTWNKFFNHDIFGNEQNTYYQKTIIKDPSTR